MKNQQFFNGLLDRLAERTGAAIIVAHHFPKGNAKMKALIDRLAGSAVFVRHADSVICFTPHIEPECFTVETVLRNFPQLPSFVVQWDYPVMIMRDDLTPEDLESNADANEEQYLAVLALLDAGPLRSGDWERQSITLGLSRATFHRVKRALREGDHVTFDRATRTFCRVVSEVAVQPVNPPATQAEPVVQLAREHLAVTKATGLESTVPRRL